MAFRLNVDLEKYEFRALRTGNGKNGVWMSIVLESPKDASQVDVSVRSQMQPEIYDLQLKKGDVLTVNVVAFAGPDYSRVTLEKVLQVVDRDGEVLV